MRKSLAQWQSEKTEQGFAALPAFGVSKATVADLRVIQIEEACKGWRWEAAVKYWGTLQGNTQTDPYRARVAKAAIAAAMGAIERDEFGLFVTSRGEEMLAALDILGVAAKDSEEVRAALQERQTVEEARGVVEDHRAAARFAEAMLVVERIQDQVRRPSMRQVIADVQDSLVHAQESYEKRSQTIQQALDAHHDGRAFEEIRQLQQEFPKAQAGEAFFATASALKQARIVRAQKQQRRTRRRKLLGTAIALVLCVVIGGPIAWQRHTTYQKNARREVERAAAEATRAAAEAKRILVSIPAGTFTMGDTHLDGGADEKPTHSVSLAAFWLDKTEVTNAQFAQFVQAGNTAQGTWREHASGKDQHPVVNVPWHEALAYCRWVGKRLPTEAEWEYAATGTDGRRYPWGNQWDKSRANSEESGIRSTTPVGQYPTGASPFGLLDLAGNVWEWTSSLYEPYPYSASDGRENLGASGDCVFRGGSWLNDQWNVRSAFRLRNDPTFRSVNLGFRCAQDVR